MLLRTRSAPKRRSIALLSASVVLLFVASAFGQHAAMELEPAQTSIHFTLKTSLHTVHGTFQLKSGELGFDPTTAKPSGMVIVDAASGESGNSGRDKKMRTQILETQKYPEIIFALVEAEGAVQSEGDSHVLVKGTFRIHGEDHPMTIPVDLHVSGSDFTFDTAFSIPYIAWGLKNPSTFILRASDTVQIDIHGAGRRMVQPPN